MISEQVVRSSRMTREGERKFTELRIRYNVRTPRHPTPDTPTRKGGKNEIKINDVFTHGLDVFTVIKK